MLFSVNSRGRRRHITLTQNYNSEADVNIFSFSTKQVVEFFRGMVK